MKYLKLFESFIRTDISNVVKDSLVDIVDDGFETNLEYFRDELKVFINKYDNEEEAVLFSFNEVKDSINQLLSQMDGSGQVKLKNIQYLLSLDLDPDIINGGWKKIGNVKGNKLLRIYHIEDFNRKVDGVNDMKWISEFQITFISSKKFEANSNAGSIYAGDNRHVGGVTSQIFEPLDEFHYKCKECEMKFTSFLKENAICKECGSPNVEPVLTT